jgi:hypothetical protein
LAGPHRDDAAEMGRKLGADLVLYPVIPVGTRLQSVPHITYEPGQSCSGTTSGVVGGVFGPFHTYGSSPGSLHSRPFPLRDQAIIELLYSSGLRISELTGARLENLSLPEP